MRRKRIYMETTQISAARTVAQIQEILGRYGAEAILTEYDRDTREVVSVSFKITIGERKIPFTLPCRWQSIFEALKSRRRRGAKDKDLQQAKRVAWRQILRWVEAQLALVETDMVKMQEVFLPYTVRADGKTIYESIEAKGFKALGFTEEEEA